jgi:hypothetical protein
MDSMSKTEMAAIAALALAAAYGLGYDVFTPRKYVAAAGDALAKVGLPRMGLKPETNYFRGSMMGGVKMPVLRQGGYRPDDNVIRPVGAAVSRSGQKAGGRQQGVQLITEAYKSEYGLKPTPDVPDTRVPTPTYWDDTQDDALAVADAYGELYGQAAAKAASDAAAVNGQVGAARIRQGAASRMGAEVVYYQNSHNNPGFR